MKISSIFAKQLTIKNTNIMKTLLKDFALALALWLAFFTCSLILLNVI